MSDPSPPATPPGWYPDPYRRAARRYWDGARWTGHVDPPAAPAPAAPAPSTHGSTTPAAPPASPRPAKTNGWAIASLVLGILGGSVLAIIFGLVARGQIKRSGGRQQGMGLATAGIALGAVWLALVAVVIVLGVTGAFDDDNAGRFSGVDKQVAAVVDDVEAGLGAGDGRHVCDVLFTPRWSALVARGAGRTCAAFIGEVDSGRRQAHLAVKSISVTGGTATARVDEASTRETWRFVREGGRWRVDEIRK